MLYIERTQTHINTLSTSIIISSRVVNVVIVDQYVSVWSIVSVRVMCVTVITVCVCLFVCF